MAFQRKPTVKYRDGYGIAVGGCACIIPIDHYSEYVSNGRYATTSTILSYDSNTGEFETMNTRYVMDTAE